MVYIITLLFILVNIIGFGILHDDYHPTNNVPAMLKLLGFTSVLFGGYLYLLIS